MLRRKSANFDGVFIEERNGMVTVTFEEPANFVPNFLNEAGATKAMNERRLQRAKARGSLADQKQDRDVKELGLLMHDCGWSYHNERFKFCWDIGVQVPYEQQMRQTSWRRNIPAGSSVPLDVPAGLFGDDEGEPNVMATHQIDYQFKNKVIRTLVEL